MLPKKINYLLIAPLMVAILIATNSCYYDNEEYLYADPAGPGSCDTTNVTYSGTVAPIMATYCNGCHNASSPSDGIIVDNYNDLIITVGNGSFWGSINHEAGFSPMPRNQPKLSDCNLLKIRKWLDDGAVNN